MHWIKRLLWGLLALIVPVTGVFFTGVALPLSAPKAQPVEARLLVRNVRLVDVETGVIRNGTDLLIEHGRIVAVGTDLQAGDARQLDGGGLRTWRAQQW